MERNLRSQPSRTTSELSFRTQPSSSTLELGQLSSRARPDQIVGISGALRPYSGRAVAAQWPRSGRDSGRAVATVKTQRFVKISVKKEFSLS